MMISCDNLTPSAPAIGLDVDVDASISEAALPVNFCGILPTDDGVVAQILGGYSRQHRQVPIALPAGIGDCRLGCLDSIGPIVPPSIPAIQRSRDCNVPG